MARKALSQVEKTHDTVCPLIFVCFRKFKGFTGFPLYLEIRENLENEFHFFQSGKSQGILEKCLKSGKNQGICSAQERILLIGLTVSCPHILVITRWLPMMAFWFRDLCYPSLSFWRHLIHFHYFHNDKNLVGDVSK